MIVEYKDNNVILNPSEMIVDQFYSMVLHGKLVFICINKNGEIGFFNIQDKENTKSNISTLTIFNLVLTAMLVVSLIINITRS